MLLISLGILHYRRDGNKTPVLEGNDEPLKPIIAVLLRNLADAYSVETRAGKILEGRSGGPF
jgi:hypothetical protein